MPFDGFVENTQVTERLLISRARIEAGWCQNHLHRSKWTWYGRRDHYCLIGSVIEDLQPHGLAMKSAVQLLEEAIERLGYGHKSLLEFNDEYGRIKEEVLEVCKLAIAMSRGVPEPLIFLREKVA